MSFQVQIPETGESFVAKAGETVLAAALRADVRLPHDCQAGGCGTCRVRLAAGSVSYDEAPFGLSPEEEAEGYALACQAVPEGDLVIEVPLVTVTLPEPRLHTAVVAGIEPLCDGVSRLTLTFPDDPAPDYLPGQYMNVLLEDGVIRSFSMGSAPGKGVLDFHVRRNPGGRFTDRLLARAKPGDRIRVELPMGSFLYREEDYRPLLMVATGTGIAPLRSILEALMDDPDCPPVHLYWGMRTEADLYLDREIRTWGDRFDEFTYVPVLSRPGPSWDGRRGHVQDAVAEDFGDLSEHAVYLCGSPAMIVDAKRIFMARGASPDHVYVEGFTTGASAGSAAVPVPAA